MICKDCFHYELCNDFVFGGGIELSNAKSIEGEAV